MDINRASILQSVEILEEIALSETARVVMVVNGLQRVVRFLGEDAVKEAQFYVQARWGVAIEPKQPKTVTKTYEVALYDTDAVRY